ncbi:hypothetical protein BJ508DRAFT_17329 [Ascobolus immersus RN42]|uniref:Uncharacterized protein n=1 Tax=Ascobolus immersus RN42 TaxID=1160509 RepID=A0A3N4HT36_ASCIM|nr:hypothetical protein BJ508DRAFT_17329 [Ascobolus immersus RN42]
MITDASLCTTLASTIPRTMVVWIFSARFAVISPFQPCCLHLPRPSEIWAAEVAGLGWASFLFSFSFLQQTPRASTTFSPLFCKRTSGFTGGFLFYFLKVLTYFSSTLSSGTLSPFRTQYDRQTFACIPNNMLAPITPPDPAMPPSSPSTASSSPVTTSTSSPASTSPSYPAASTTSPSTTPREGGIDAVAYRPTEAMGLRPHRRPILPNFFADPFSLSTHFSRPHHHRRPSQQAPLWILEPQQVMHPMFPQIMSGKPKQQSVRPLSLDQVEACSFSNSCVARQHLHCQQTGSWGWA